MRNGFDTALALGGLLQKFEPAGMTLGFSDGSELSEQRRLAFEAHSYAAA